ncbi:triosephosphate isomerase-like [Papaver somniferum]|uniref:triosephosphate isomerase-like n=1 Tax=Papaver somniferum TaxID=3469 RepID=UPI000E701BE5|nr:triosephosphate isomerase-like [Papaver somniferum]
MNFVCVLADYNVFVCVSADFSSGGAFGVSMFEAVVKHENKVQKISRLDFIFHYLSVSAFVEVQVLEEDEKVVVVASSGSCVSAESIEMLSSLNIPWVILNLFERSALLNESNEFFRKKVAYALSQGFKVIAGVSETLE